MMNTAGKLPLLLLASLLLCLVLVPLASAKGVEDLPSSVYILSDGSVYSPDEGHLYLKRDGDYYYFTQDNNDYLIVQRDNITINGQGFTLASPPRVYGRVGLTLPGLRNVTVCNLTFSSVWKGVDIQASKEINLLNVTVQKCRFGVYVSNSTQVKIDNCNIVENEEEGLKLLNSEQNSIKSSNVTGNGSGIYLEQASENDIILNRISQNQDGIVLIESDNNTIQTNNITLNEKTGFWIYQSYSNTLYYNNIIENEEQAVSIESQNSWRNNYYSDYTGTDDDGDGLGDQSYIINEDNQDNHPSVDVVPEFPLFHIAFVFIFSPLLIYILRKTQNTKNNPGAVTV